jgi:uncharacterized membrane protein YeaQ/YmgE (transglycosylase-associated protein family)
LQTKIDAAVNAHRRAHWAISGVIAKSVMHVRMTIFWTIVLGIIGPIIGGAVTHMFSRPTNNRYQPAGLIFFTLGAILSLFICYKLKIHFPRSTRSRKCKLVLVQREMEKRRSPLV